MDAEKLTRTLLEDDLLDVRSLALTSGFNFGKLTEHLKTLGIIADFDVQTYAHNNPDSARISFSVVIKKHRFANGVRLSDPLRDREVVAVNKAIREFAVQNGFRVHVYETARRDENTVELFATVWPR